MVLAIASKELAGGENKSVCVCVRWGEIKERERREKGERKEREDMIR